MTDTGEDAYADAVKFLAVKASDWPWIDEPSPLPDDGEAAIRREVAAAVQDELDRNGYVVWDDPVIERTEEARRAFVEKLAYWREHGVPGYLGPRAGRDT